MSTPLVTISLLLRTINDLRTQAEADAAEIKRLSDAHALMSHEIDQALGKALGYPWYCHDQCNFPGATEADGVCTGEHVPESLADEAANRIRADAALIAELTTALKWYFDRRTHTTQHCSLRQSIGEWCSFCEREQADVALLQRVEERAAAREETA